MKLPFLKHKVLMRRPQTLLPVVVCGVPEEGV